MNNRNSLLNFLTLLISVASVLSCQAEIDRSKLDRVDDTTSIRIQSHHRLLPEIVIDDSDKVSFAKEFVHKHTKNDNWVGPPPFSDERPGPVFSISFWEEDKLLFWLGFKPPDTLIYLPYKKSIPKEEIILLIDTLDIPEEYIIPPK